MTFVVVATLCPGLTSTYLMALNERLGLYLGRVAT